MRIILAATAATALMGLSAQATSIVDRAADRIAENLAELTATGFYCQDRLTINYNMVDLIWDIVELKSGLDPDSEAFRNEQTPRLNEAGARAEEDAAGFCTEMIAAYGPDGNDIAGVVSPR